MIQGTGTTSLRKKELTSDRIPTIGYSKLMAAHKATAGQTGINLLSLSTPTEMSAYGFVQPSAAALQAAQMLFYPKNVTVMSSTRGMLDPYLSYTITSNTAISFNDFTALQDEIFIVTIDYSFSSGVRVVDAAPILASGTLAVSTTDFNVGTPFRVGQSTASQIGAVMVFLDGILQTRNTSNSSVTLDGNYYEVDAGASLGTIVRFNVVDPVNVRNVLVVSTGALSERPDGSMMAAIENISGRLNNVATHVAAATGNTVTTILGAAPSDVDLKAFGDRVIAIENNRARIDTSNTWTAYQQMLGRTDGVAVPASYIGERIDSSGATTAALVSGALTNAHSYVLGPGVWDVFGAINFSVSGADATTQKVVMIGVSTTSALHIEPYYDVSYAEGMNIVGFRKACPSIRVTVSVSTTVYLVVRMNNIAGTAGTVTGVNPTIVAVRIA